jgi:hypothetical protein
MADGSQPASQPDRQEEDAADSGGRAPKYPCLRCKKNVGRNSVRCNTCQLWVHVECGGISKEVFNILANPTKYGVGINWNCDSCQASAARLDARINALEGRFTEVEGRVIRSEAVVMEANRRVENVEARQSKLEQTVEQERERARRERAEEMRERDIRKRNVIMHRVGEAGADVRTIEERKAWDLRSCDNIFSALRMDFTCENAVKFCRRVGERGDGPRPLIVGLKREWQKEDLLEKARDLRNTAFSDVVIIPDLTKEQRKEEAEMVGEVEKRNSELSQEDKAKNLEWAVIGARGERRMVKGPVRTRGGRGAARGVGGGQPLRGGAALAPVLLPARHVPETWDPLVQGRGAGAAQRGRPGRRPSNKRTRTERRELEEYSEPSEEEMEMERRPAQPLPPQPTMAPPPAAQPPLATN